VLTLLYLALRNLAKMDHASDELESVLSRFAAVQNINENQSPIIYTTALTLAGDSLECALALSFHWRSL
jgi:hypothetical protein